MSHKPIPSLTTTHCRCGLRCAYADTPNEPCWGAVEVEDNQPIAGESDIRIHACRGHAPMVDHGAYDGQYLPRPVVKKTAHAAMAAWDKTWQMHYLPLWIRKRIRLRAIRQGLWRPCRSSADDFLPPDVFDHWGSVVRGNVRALVAQPYGEHDALARAFATELDCSLKIASPGPWHEGTRYYEFLPNVPEEPVKLAAPVPGA